MSRVDLWRIEIRRRRRGLRSSSRKWRTIAWCCRRWNRYAKYFSCLVRSAFSGWKCLINLIRSVPFSVIICDTVIFVRNTLFSRISSNSLCYFIWSSVSVPWLFFMSFLRGSENECVLWMVLCPGSTELHAHTAISTHVLPQQSDQPVPQSAEHRRPRDQQSHDVYDASSRVCQRYVMYTYCISL